MVSEDVSCHSCAVIIVTHNSQKYLPTCLQALQQQTRRPAQLIVVDSGSQETSYLTAYAHDSSFTLHLAQENVGFCQGNNIGMSYVQASVQYVLFLNPDAFLTPSFLEQAIAYLEQPSAQQVGALSGILLGYNIQEQQPTGRIDSTGVFRTWYGRWYDRGQGEFYQASPECQPEQVPALCGALFLCRMQALQGVQLAPHVIMDPTFYMYKEDIDLSLRLRRQGWSLLVVPQLIAYHCRGWQQDRSKMPHHLRLQSAKNEMRLYARLKSPCYFYSLLKYWMVKTRFVD